MSVQLEFILNYHLMDTTAEYCRVCIVTHVVETIVRCLSIVSYH